MKEEPTICGWKLRCHGKVWKAEMRVNPEHSAAVEAWISDAAIQVLDHERYYPSGDYTIPLAVIEALQSRQVRP